MRIALAGLGTVGASVLRLLRTQREFLGTRGADIAVIAVSARDRAKRRDCDLSGVEWVADPRLLALRDDVDTVVEVIGGDAGVALDLARASLGNGKHFITANKAMIATHGVELARLAEQNNVQLAFEAAVCGGIPIVKTLRENLAANNITKIFGILNGTSNYILTRMADANIDFNAALAEAQAKGYAEADPSADIDGHDAACKLAILSALAFGTAPDLAAVNVMGIRDLSATDLRDAAMRGGRIKLVGVAMRDPSGVSQIVAPIFISGDQALARVDGVLNGIEIDGDFCGPLFLQGAGAGGDATASSVVADLVDIARGHRGPAFGILAAKLA